MTRHRRLDAFGRVLNEEFAPDTDACPDCRADVRLLDLGGGVKVLRIEHDDSCPWFNQREGDRS